MNNTIPNNLILPFTNADHTKDEVVIERGEGPYLFDVSGKKYLDGSSSLWVSILGHNHPIITQRITDQARKISHASLFGGAHTPAIELTQRLLEFMGLPEYSVFFSNSGSEAIEAAMKMTMDYWREKNESKRKYIVTFENSYHGETSGAMSVSGFQDHGKMYPHLLLQKLEARSPVSTVMGKRLATKQKPLDSLDEIIERHLDEIAAIIVEPAYGAGGILFPDELFLKRVEALCREHGYLLIVDEVATGFYRTGTKFCYEASSVQPDIIVLGKALSAGYLPLSATVAAPKIGELYSRKNRRPGFMHGHTFSGNPLACSAALGNIEVLESPDFVDTLQSGIEYFSEKIRSLLHPSIAETRQKGYFAGIELFDDEKEADWRKAALDVCNAAKKNGVLIRPLGNTVVLAPPYIVEQTDIDTLINTLQEALHTIFHNYRTYE